MDLKFLTYFGKEGSGSPAGGGFFKYPPQLCRQNQVFVKKINYRFPKISGRLSATTNLLSDIFTDPLMDSWHHLIPAKRFFRHFRVEYQDFPASIRKIYKYTNIFLFVRIYTLWGLCMLEQILEYVRPYGARMWNVLYFSVVNRARSEGIPSFNLFSP